MLISAVVLALVPAGAMAQAASFGLSPATGPPGSVVTGSGSNWFLAASPVVVYWGSLTGPVVGGPATVNANLSFSTSVTIPKSASSGPHTVIACQFCFTEFEVRASTTFTVTEPPPPTTPPSPPDAVDDSITTTQDTPVTHDVTANDTDPNGDLVPGSVFIPPGAGPTMGTASAVGNGLVTYTPNAGFTGTDSFLYGVCDATNLCDEATVQVTVNQPPPPPPPPSTTTTTTTTTTTEPPNEPPDLQDDASVTVQGSSASIPVTANDTDPEGDLDLASLRLAFGPNHGTAAPRGDGTFLYAPDPGFSGSDNFSYRLCDTAGACDVATVTIEVQRLEVLGVETCSLGPEDVESLTVEPASGEPETEVDLNLQVFEDAVEGCEPPLVVFTFDGEALGGPVRMQPNPGALATRAIPAGSSPGVHTLGAEQVGGPVLAEASFEVLGAAVAPPPPVEEGGGGAPLWLAPVATAPLLIAGAFVYRRRRPDYSHPPIDGLPPDECTDMREKVVEAEQEAAEAQQEAEESAGQAQEAGSRAEQARSELRACEEAAVPAGEDAEMPLVAAHMPDSATAEVGAGFHLLEHENPNAPMQGDGRLGWFQFGRSAGISGVVLRVASGVTAAGTAGGAMDVAETYTKAAAPRSVHAVVDREGTVELLPDDYVAMHTPGNDEATLALEVVMEDDDEVDDAALEHAAAWFADKARRHGIGIRRLTREEWLAGASGIIAQADLMADGGSGAGFSWARFLDLAEAAGELPRPVAAAVPLEGSGQADPCADLRQQSQHADTEAQEATQRSEQASRRAADATEAIGPRRDSLWECECRVPAQEVPQEPVEEEPERNRNRWYLLEHENPNARVRSNRKRGWYKPVRKAPIQGIVVHTAEAMSASGVANYFAQCTRPSSAHVVVGGNGWVKLLPDRFQAFHVKGANASGLGMEFAYEADAWGTNPGYEEAVLRTAASWCGIKATTYGIPRRRLTRKEWLSGERGFIAHSDLDPGRRTDPGPDFPWDRFLSMVDTMSLSPSGAGDR